MGEECLKCLRGSVPERNDEITLRCRDLAKIAYTKIWEFVYSSKLQRVPARLAIQDVSEYHELKELCMHNQIALEYLHDSVIEGESVHGIMESDLIGRLDNIILFNSTIVISQKELQDLKEKREADIKREENLAKGL